MPDKTQVTDRQKLKEYQHRIIVAGTRRWNDYKLFAACMNEYLESLPTDVLSLLKPFIFITGDASSGADAFIIRYAKEKNQSWISFPAKWDEVDVAGSVVKTKTNARTGEITRYNANAGFQRNKEMAEYGSRLVAFWDGKSPGTKDMREQARLRKLSLTTYLVKINEPVVT